MATKTKYWGTLGPFPYDDSYSFPDGTPSGIHTDGIMRCTRTPTTAGDVLRFDEMPSSGGIAPSNGQYLVLAAHGDMSDERVFTPSTGMVAVDGGAGSTYTLTVNLSTGISGGQTAYGSVDASENLVLDSTSHATKGEIHIQPGGGTVYVGAVADEANQSLGIVGGRLISYQPDSNAWAHVFNDSTLRMQQTVYNAGTANNVIVECRRAGGTYASPLVCPDDARALSYRALFHDGTDFILGGAISLEGDGTISTNTVPCKLIIDLMDASGNYGEVFRINEAGEFGFGGIDPSVETNSFIHARTTTAGKEIVFEEQSGGAGAGPIFVLFRDSGSPATGDEAGKIIFRGDDDGGAETNYSSIVGLIGREEAGDESGQLDFRVLMDNTERNMIRIRGDNGTLNEGEILVNSESQDVDVAIYDSSGKILETLGSGAIGVFATTPAAQTAAYTQTYSTTTRTAAALTQTALTDSTTGTAGTTLNSIGNSTVNDNFASVIAQLDNIKADIENIKQVQAQTIDDHQGYGWFQ